MKSTTSRSFDSGSLAVGVLVLAAVACVPEAQSARRETADAIGGPPSGLYRASPTTLSDTCTPRDGAGTAAGSFFVTTSASGSSVHANVPLTFDGFPWEELASRTTIDFDKTMTLVDSPAPRCPGARRRRDIRVEPLAGDASRTGFDVDVAETWSVPEAGDCELPSEAPRRSCERVRRIALRVEKACPSERELVRLACDQDERR